MEKINFNQTQFVTSAKDLEGYPSQLDNGTPLFEIAVGGRSNVGKSSLLNNLFGTKNLVKTSGVPGKTQLLNFFRVGNEYSFVDLPGYGFAQVPKAIREQWGPMIQTYFENRQSLGLILILLDIRRIPNEDDKVFLEWISYYKIPILLILTKVDKVNLTIRRKNTQRILDGFKNLDLPYLHYSSKKRIGRTLLITRIRDMMKR